MKILIVDDDEMQLSMLQDFLEKQGYETFTATSGEKALDIFKNSPIQLVLMDHRMNGMSGDEALEEMKGLSPTVKAVMITAHGSVETAVRVMKIGIDDFLEKPVDLSRLLDIIRDLGQTLAVKEESEKVTREMESTPLPVTIIGSGEKMRILLSMVYRAAPTDWSVLISGETGTGKELIARLIHEMSHRKEAPFIEVNCAAVPETLFESELFGHEKGAFTGASIRRRGRFELARGGSVFLDEVGELPLPLQAKLLRALQEKKICRVGGEIDIDVDMRVIAATNKDLKKMVIEGSFREDLYFRLNVLELEVPPLRERRKDITELITHFLEKYQFSDTVFDDDTVAQLVKYDFPGNVRELEHLIQRLGTLTRSNVIRLHDLPSIIREKQASKGLLSKRLERVETEMIQNALKDYNGVQTQAARSLGISERVLRYKMEKLGIPSASKGDISAGKRRHQKF